MAVGYRSSSVSGTSATLGSSCTTPVPAGAASGDIALLCITQWESTNPVVTWPTGFTEKINFASGSSKLKVAWKRLTGADTGNYVASWTGSQWNMGHCVLITGGVATGDPIEATNTASGTGTSVPSTSVTTTTEPFLAHFNENLDNSAVTSTPPTSYTEVQDGDYLHTNYRIPATTGSHTASGGTISASSLQLVALLAISPADSGTTVSPTGIASAEAFGTATVTATLTVSPSGVATGEAVGTPTVTATLTASPAGVASAEAVGSPAVTATLTVTPSGIATAEAFGTVTVTVAGSVSPTGIASAEAFGTPTITATLTSSPTGIASAEVVGTPTVTATLTASPGSVASTEAVGAPLVTATLTVQPGGIASAETFGTLVVQTGALRNITVIAGLRSNHVTGGVTLAALIAGLRSNHIQGGVDVPRDMVTGSVEYVTAEVTFVGETAAGIASATGQMKITSDDTIPSTWDAADVTTRTDVTGGAKLSLSRLHTAGPAGYYRVWAKVTDNPEIPILLCGTFSVR